MTGTITVTGNQTGFYDGQDTEAETEGSLDRMYAKFQDLLLDYLTERNPEFTIELVEGDIAGVEILGCEDFELEDEIKAAVEQDMDIVFSEGKWAVRSD